MLWPGEFWGAVHWRREDCPIRCKKLTHIAGLSPLDGTSTPTSSSVQLLSCVWLFATQWQQHARPPCPLPTHHHHLKLWQPKRSPDIAKCLRGSLASKTIVVENAWFSLTKTPSESPGVLLNLRWHYPNPWVSDSVGLIQDLNICISNKFSNTLATWCKEPTHCKRLWCWKRLKGTTEDEMVGWHHCLDGHKFEQTPRDGEGQGGLESCSLLGQWLRVRHDWVTEQQVPKWCCCWWFRDHPLKNPCLNH